MFDAGRNAERLGDFIVLGFVHRDCIASIQKLKYSKTGIDITKERANDRRVKL